MGTGLKIDKGSVPMHRRSADSVRSEDNIMQCLYMQKELDVVILLSFLILLVFPQILVLRAMARKCDIYRNIVWWVGPQGEGQHDEQPGVMKLVVGIFLGLCGVIYQLI